MKTRPLKIDIFCHIVDNLGDIGVCWRLCKALVRDQGCYVRLFIDDLKPFAMLEPMLDKTRDVQHLEGVEVFRWYDGLIRNHYHGCGDAVIEAFGCDLPDKVIELISDKSVPPVWIDLEYMSAEEWVDTHHAVVSPHPQMNLNKTLFFPGFTEKTGGLTREKNLIEERVSFQADVQTHNQWRDSIGMPPLDDDVIDISLFCYAVSPIERLLAGLRDSGRPVRVMVPAGVAREAIQNFTGKVPELGTVIVIDNINFHNLPFMIQSDYDRLLWTCDLNFVRGEDSLVRAVWAGNPLVWDIYKQDRNAHMAKLKAFHNHYWNGLAPECREILDFFSAMWNEGGRQDADLPAERLLACLPTIREHARLRSLEQAGQEDLATRLVTFIRTEMKSNKE